MIEFKTFVMNWLHEKYNYSIKESRNMVDDSAFFKSLKRTPWFVMHYSVDYWAKDIISEYDFKEG